MILLAIQKNPDGSHDENVIFGGDPSFIPIPDTHALLPEEVGTPETLESYPYGDIEVDYSGAYNVVTKWTAGTVPDPLPAARADREAGLSAACKAAITAGMDVETSAGVEHFSLEETDQINLTAAVSAVQSGAAGYPYHADGALCRMFSAGEILAIGEAATGHKLYHTTLCNHLLTWARRAQSVEELRSITYSAENLPQDLAENMAAIFTAAAVEV